MKKVAFLFFIIISLVFAQDMVIRIYAKSYQELKKITPKTLDIAAAHAGEWYDIVADQATLNQIIGSGLAYEIRIQSLAAEKEKVRGQYHSYDEINTIMQDLANNYPNICEYISLPIPSYEGRWVYGLKISDNPSLEEDDEPGVLIDGCHHAREWATPVLVLFFADSIIKSYGVVSEITEIINNTEIYCFPIINVDGYVYDWVNYQGWWRKNREPFGGSIGNDCNRNYAGCSGDLEGDWGAVDDGKATHRPNYETFCGPYVNSGDEVRSYVTFAKDHVCNALMTYHSYGELLMWPWGWGPESTPDNALFVQVGNDMADLVQRLGGGVYDRGPGYSTIYPVSGSTHDWYYSWCHYVGGFSNLSFITEVGTDFYQPVGDLDNIFRENFKALKYLAQVADSVVLVAEGVVPAPEIHSLGTMNSDFTVAWHARNVDDNHPTQWELVELSNPSVIEDDLESGTGRWFIQGFTLSTAQAHSGTNSFFSGNNLNMNRAVQTIHPYLVESGDSVTFWCYYNLEVNYDVAVVEVSENTKEWFNLDTTRFNGNQSSWVRKAYSLDGWTGRSVYVRFRVMSDDGINSGGFYVDDISPVCLFADVDTISSNITDTLYQFLGHALGQYYFYVRGYNATWGWGDYSCLAKASIVGIAEENDSGLDNQVFSLRVSPNPFCQATNIKFQAPNSKSQTNSNNQNSIRIYDISGKVIKNLSLPTAYSLVPTSVVWDGTDESGKRVPAGIYFVDFSAGKYRQIEKAVLLK